MQPAGARNSTGNAEATGREEARSGLVSWLCTDCPVPGCFGEARGEQSRARVGDRGRGEESESREREEEERRARVRRERRARGEARGEQEERQDERRGEERRGESESREREERGEASAEARGEGRDEKKERHRKEEERRERRTVAKGGVWFADAISAQMAQLDLQSKQQSAPYQQQQQKLDVARDGLGTQLKQLHSQQLQFSQDTTVTTAACDCCMWVPQ